jgi:ACS family sodium-dependent inorganic phosphate cotransporter-like MFS transporter 5
MWLLCVADTPSQHPRITESERKYIESSIGGNSGHIPLSETPWLMFLKSKPFWAIIVAHVCSNWGNYCLLTSMPGYMKEVLKFDIKSNGFMSAIPYVVYWIVINVGGVSADKLRQRGWSTKLVRKILLTLGCIPPGILLIVTGYIPCTHPYLAVGVLSLAVGTSGFHFSSVLVNHIDIAPPFAGTLFGISNTLATIPGFLSPYVVKLITVNSSQEEWQIVFYITGAIYLFGAVFYCIFADGEVQDWALPYMMKRVDPDEEKQLQPLKMLEKDGTQHKNSSH